MQEPIPLLTLFSLYEPAQAHRAFFRQAQVEKAEIDAATRRVQVRARAPVYLPQARLDEAAREIERLYGIRSLTLEPVYPPELLEQCDFSELRAVLSEGYSLCAGILAGCSWRLEGDTLHLHLRANGKDQLQPCLPRAQRYLRERFGRSVTIEVHTGMADEGREALFAETERFRQEAMEQSPAPVFREEKKEKKPPEPSAIYGRPFRGEATPMADLTLDMFKVIVEGEVFAVAHRELKKRGAWVIGFDMTDYRGSVHVSQFLEAEKAKPILSGVKKGMWLRVQGKMTFDRYEGENVL